MKNNKLIGKVILLLSFLMVANSYSDEGFSFKYKLPILPIEISYDESGLKISGSSSILTPIGVFSIGYNKSVVKFDKDYTYVIIEDIFKQKEHIYKVKDKQFLTLISDGEAIIKIEKNKVRVFIKKGSSFKINFEVKGKKISKNYSIQILATSNKNKANREKKKLEIDGYTTYVIPVILNGKQIFRVRVGSFSSKKKARTSINKMRKRYTKNKSIKNSIIVTRELNHYHDDLDQQEGSLSFVSSAKKLAEGKRDKKISSNYSIQILATSSEIKAYREKRIMEVDGYTAYITQVASTGKQIFRVRVGSFSSKEEARISKNKMIKRYAKNKSIKYSFIVSKKINNLSQKSSINSNIKNYSIQLISTSRKRLAEKAVSDFKKEGYRPYITKYRLDGRLLYRVRLINIDNYRSASDYLDKLKRIYQKNTLIQNATIMKINDDG